MKNSKIVNVYFESEEVSIRIVSNPKSADIVINGDGTISTAENKKSIKDVVVFKKDVEDNENISAENVQIDPNQLEIDISNILLNMGILPHIKGYRYTVEAVKMLVNDPEMINAVTKSLYPKVGEIFKTTSSRTERAIRHAIEIAYDRGNHELLNELFKLPSNSSKTKPTNSEFLSCLAEHFRFEKKNIK